MSEWPAARRDRLRRDLAALVDEAPGRWSIAVHEAGQVAEIDAHVVQHPASTIKVPIMAVVLLDVAAGTRSLDDVVQAPPPADRTGGSGVLQFLPSVSSLTVGETIGLMIVVSDNAATNMLVDLVGTDRLQEGFAELGLAATRMERHINDVDAAERGLRMESSAHDLASLLDRLGAGELFPGEITGAALGILGGQHFTDRLPARLSEADVTVRNKTGTIEGVGHDAGILEFDGRRVSVAALGRDLPLHGQTFVAADVISRVADLVVGAGRA